MTGASHEAKPEGNVSRQQASSATLANHNALSHYWQHASKSLWRIGLVATAYAICFAALALQLPKLTLADHVSMSAFPPRTIPEIVVLRDFVKLYAASFPVHVVLGFCLAYISMQTFAIPGTLSLSLLGGALYNAPIGLLLVSVISTLGASACYGMSRMCGKELVQAIWPGKLKYFEEQVARRKANLLSYIVLLRLTPVLPNTFINVASPLVGVPLAPFMLGTWLGCMPNNLVAVSAGTRLAELHSLRDLYDYRLLTVGMLTALVAVLPIALEHTPWRLGSSPQGSKHGAQKGQ